MNEIKEEIEEHKAEIKDKVKYREHRVLCGYAPHKLIKMEIQTYLKKAKDEIKDIFDINRIKWKGLHKEEQVNRNDRRTKD